MAAKKKATKKKAVPVRKKLSDEQIAEQQTKLAALRNAPVHMPKSVMEARHKQASKLGTGEITGRPTGYIPETIEAFLKNVRSGLPVQRAAVMAGIGKSTLYRWAEQYSDFRDAVEQAESEYQAFALGTVNEGIANGDGHLAMKLLGARFSDEYATSKKVDVRSTHVSSSISADHLAGLQSARLETDITSAANAIETEQTKTLEEKVTQNSHGLDDPSENDGGEPHTTGGRDPNTPPPLNDSHTELSRHNDTTPNSIGRNDDTPNVTPPKCDGKESIDPPNNDSTCDGVTAKAGGKANPPD
jgi:hypothetical protein